MDEEREGQMSEWTAMSDDEDRKKKALLINHQ